MANHNILIKNPRGDRSLQFVDNRTMKECRYWLEEYGPAPIGWFYQIVNMHKRNRKYPLYTLIQGFDVDNNIIDQRKANVKTNGGWYSVKDAKRDARRVAYAQGKAIAYFTREKIWKEED